MRSTFAAVLPALGLLVLGCSDGSSPTAPTAARPALAGASWGPETPNFNLEVILRGDGFGHVKFRQPNDAQAIIYLDPWVRGLAPNTEYVLQRAVDAVVDDVCTSTAWLTLGRGLEPQSILTDAGGNRPGRALPRRLRVPAGNRVRHPLPGGRTPRPRRWCCRASATSSGSACSCRNGGAGRPCRSAPRALRQNRCV